MTLGVFFRKMAEPGQSAIQSESHVFSLIVSADSKAWENDTLMRSPTARFESGRAMIYATVPRMEVVATFRIERVLKGPLAALWRAVKDRAAVTKGEFLDYYSGLDEGIAIEIVDVSQLLTPIPLQRLRAAWGADFQPPQGFRYMQPADLSKLASSLKLVS